MILNPKSITDEMLALSALRSVTAPDGGKAPNLPLTRDSLPGLRVVMRMVFAETMLQLAPHLEACVMDPADPPEQHPFSDDEPLCLEATVCEGRALPRGMELAVKRELEHLVAAGTLGWIASENDTAFAALLQSQREKALSALKSVLDESAAAFTRSPWP